MPQAFRFGGLRVTSVSSGVHRHRAQTLAATAMLAAVSAPWAAGAQNSSAPRADAAPVAVVPAAARSPLAKSDAALVDAAMRGDAAIARAMLAAGARVTATQGDGMTPLHWAAERGDAALARLLLGANARPEATTRIGGLTPLHLAARNGNADLVRLLLAAPGDARARARARTADSVTPLHLAAMGGDPAIIDQLIAAGADVNAAEPAMGTTPLMAAAARGRAAAVKRLLAHGADTRAVGRVSDPVMMTAQDRVAKAQRNRTLAALRDSTGQTKNAGWQPNSQQVQRAVAAATESERLTASPEALAAAAAANAAEEARMAAQGGPGLDEDSPAYIEQLGMQGGLTALLFAVREGQLEVIDALLAGGADVNATSGDHTSPLLMAAINGHYDAMLKLLAAKADPNMASDAGATPLYALINKEWAPITRTPQPAYQLQQRASYLDVTKALLKAGANPNARLKKSLWYTSYNRDNLRVDFVGATPFFRAAYATDVPLMEILLAGGADPSIGTIKPVARSRRPTPTDTAGRLKDPSGLPPVPDGGLGITPIHAAAGVGYGQGFAANDHRHAADGWLPSVKYLIETLHADVNARDYGGYTPLHFAAARGDNEMIRYLVSKGADVTAVARNGQTVADMANGPVQRISPYLDTVALLESLGSKNNHKCVSC